MFTRPGIIFQSSFLQTCCQVSDWFPILPILPISSNPRPCILTPKRNGAWRGQRPGNWILLGPIKSPKWPQKIQQLIVKNQGLHMILQDIASIAIFFGLTALGLLVEPPLCWKNMSMGIMILFWRITNSQILIVLSWKPRFDPCWNFLIW